MTVDIFEGFALQTAHRGAASVEYVEARSMDLLRFVLGGGRELALPYHTLRAIEYEASAVHGQASCELLQLTFERYEVRLYGRSLQPLVAAVAQRIVGAIWPAPPASLFRPPAAPTVEKVETVAL